MLDYKEYGKIYEEKIKKQLPASFIAMYEKSNWFHDWYLKNFYIANTGSMVLAYSNRGGSTIQIEFCTSNDDKNIILIYKNVTQLNIDFAKTDDVAFKSATGFGRCLENQFTITDDSVIQHEYSFEGNNRISIKCESISFKRIINNYWD